MMIIKPRRDSHQGLLRKELMQVKSSHQIWDVFWNSELSDLGFASEGLWICLHSRNILFKLKKIYWSMTDEQCCDRFRWTEKGLSHTDTCILSSRECMFLDSLSRQNKDLEWWTLKPPRRVTALRSWIDCVIALRSQMDRVITLRRISVTAQCYSSVLQLYFI